MQRRPQLLWRNDAIVPHHVATLIFKSQLESRLGDYPKAEQLLYQGLTIAQKYNFSELITLIDEELVNIDTYTDSLPSMKDLDAYILLIRSINDKR